MMIPPQSDRQPAPGAGFPCWIRRRLEGLGSVAVGREGASEMKPARARLAACRVRPYQVQAGAVREEDQPPGTHTRRNGGKRTQAGERNHRFAPAPSASRRPSKPARANPDCPRAQMPPARLPQGTPETARWQGAAGLPAGSRIAASWADSITGSWAVTVSPMDCCALCDTL